MLSSGDRTRGAAALKALRQRRGLSLSTCAGALLDQARLTGYLPGSLPTVAGLQRSVARWENRVSPTLPGERHQLLLAQLYARTPAGGTALGPGSDFAELLDALAHLGASQAQLQSLRETTASAATGDGTCLMTMLSPRLRAALSAALADPARTDEELAAHLSSAVAGLEQQITSLPFARLQLLLAPVAEATRHLLAGPVPEPVLPPMRQAAVAACTLGGRLAFETHDDAASHALYTEAAEQAELLGEPWRRALVHMGHTLVTLHSAGLEGTRRLADAAVRDARRGDSPAVRGWAHAWQAAMAARAQDRRLTHTAMKLAAHDAQTDHSEDPSGTVFEPWQAHCFEALCQLHTGNPRTAYDRLSQMPRPRTARIHPAEQAVLLSQQATALARTHNAQAATELLHHCIDATLTTGGRVAAVRLKWARKELQPWRNESFVTDLDDHLLDTLNT